MYQWCATVILAQCRKLFVEDAVVLCSFSSVYHWLESSEVFFLKLLLISQPTHVLGRHSVPRPGSW